MPAGQELQNPLPTFLRRAPELRKIVARAYLFTAARDAKPDQQPEPGELQTACAAAAADALAVLIASFVCCIASVACARRNTLRYGALRLPPQIDLDRTHQ